MKPLHPSSSPRDVLIKAGQTIVLYSGTSIMLRATATKDTRYFTAWQAIVGTEAEGRDQIREIFMQVAVNCGVPAGVDSFRVAKEVFAEMGV